MSMTLSFWISVALLCKLNHIDLLLILWRQVLLFSFICCKCAVFCGINGHLMLIILHMQIKGWLLWLFYIQISSFFLTCISFVLVLKSLSRSFANHPHPSSVITLHNSLQVLLISDPDIDKVKIISSQAVFSICFSVFFLLFFSVCCFYTRAFMWCVA